MHTLSGPRCQRFAAKFGLTKRKKNLWDLVALVGRQLSRTCTGVWGGRQSPNFKSFILHHAILTFLLIYESTPPPTSRGRATTAFLK